MKRKNQILLLCCFLLANLNYAQTSNLKGRVSLMNSKNSEGDIEYIKDVLISSPYSNDVKSDYKGRFSIEIKGINTKESIGLKAEKQGYEIVNKDDLEFALMEKKYTLRIFLAEEGFLENRQNNLLDVAGKFVATGKDELLDSIAFGGVDSEVAIKNLAQRSGEEIFSVFEAEELLLQMNGHLEKQLPNHTLTLAKVNSDYASKMYKAAFKYYQEGKFEDAISSIDEVHLTKAVKYVSKVLNDVIDDPGKKYKLISIRMNTLNQIKDSYALKIIALQQSFQFKKAQVALDRLTEITKISPTPKDLILLENLNISNYQFSKPQYANTVLKKEDKESDEIDYLPKDDLTEKGKEIITGERNDLEAKKNISSIEQIGDEVKKADNIIPEKPSKLLSNAEVSDFENTLFISEDANDKLISILNREKNVGASYESKKPIVVSKEIIKTNPAPLAVVQPKAQETPSVISNPVVINRNSYISVRDIVPMSTDKKMPSEVQKRKKSAKYSRQTITTRTSLRKSPTASSKVLKRLAVGTEVKVFEQVNKYWCRVTLNGREGFVKSFLLEK